MTKNATCADSVLPKPRTIPSGLERTSQKRLFAYKRLSVAFGFPDKEKLLAEYDLLFRAKEIWLYTVECLAENEFQRVNYLADISGFYRAFGLETDKERPDFLSIELEFMHFLIFKYMYALSSKICGQKEKAAICLDAQKKFFNTYLYPGAKIIARKIIAQSPAGFYKRKAIEMLGFLEVESKYIGKDK